MKNNQKITRRRIKEYVRKVAKEAILEFYKNEFGCFLDNEVLAMRKDLRTHINKILLDQFKANERLKHSALALEEYLFNPTSYAKNVYIDKLNNLDKALNLVSI